jgi:hypothetical protein
MKSEVRVRFSEVVVNITNNLLLTGTEHENKSVAQTVISTSDDRSKTLAFNYASLALNNSFFLDHLVCLSHCSSRTLPDNIAVISETYSTVFSQP